MTQTTTKTTTASAYADGFLSSAPSPEALRATILGAPAAFPATPAAVWLEVYALLEAERAVEDRVIDLAQVYFDNAARAAFAADGSVDRGSCGGVMLGYRGNTRFAKALLARGVGHKMDGRVYVTRQLPEGVATQHVAVDEAAHKAFAALCEAAGYHPSEHRSYID